MGYFPPAAARTVASSSLCGHRVGQVIGFLKDEKLPRSGVGANDVEARRRNVVGCDAHLSQPVDLLDLKFAAVFLTEGVD
jgi:hypothetical protein